MNKCKTCNIDLTNKKRIYCSNKCKFLDVSYNRSRISATKNDTTERLICRGCQWNTTDKLNKSGVITTHLKSHNIIFNRKTYLDLFDIIKIPQVTCLCCPICKWKTHDVNNKSGVFTRHITELHNIQLQDFILKYNQYESLWKTYKHKQKIKSFIELNPSAQIKCEVCQLLFKKLSNTHLKSHGITPSEYKKKYNVYSTVSNYTSDLQSDITTKYNLTNGCPMGGNDKSSFEQDFICKLEKLNIQYISPFIYKGKKFDCYIPSINFVIEIDGEAYHKNELNRLTLQTICGSCNDFSKNKLMENSSFTFYRIRYNPISFGFNSLEELKTSIINSAYIPKYSLTYRGIISKKEYFENYIEVKGKDNLQKYSFHFLKFIRTFQPELPYPDLEEGLVDVMYKIANYDLGKVYDEGSNKFSNNISTVGHNYLKHYFKSYWRSKFNNSLTPEEAWLDDKIMEDVINYRIGCNNSGEIYDFSLHQLVRGLSARRITVSFFKPLLAAAIYQHYLTTTIAPTVFDPCCGFGGRLVGYKAKYPSGKYIGCEPNVETYNELIQLIDRAGWKDVEIYNCKQEDFKNPNDYTFDLMFTSIPYYDAEIYSNNTSYGSFEEWKNTFIVALTEWAKKCTVAHINAPKELCEQLGWNNVNSYIKSNRSHFDKSTNEKLEYIITL